MDIRGHIGRTPQKSLHISMTHLQQILLDCDLRLIITDSRTRSNWVDTWKQAIRQLQSPNIIDKDTTERERTLSLISNVSHNQLLVATQMVEFEQKGEQRIEQLYHMLDALRLDRTVSDNLATTPVTEEQRHQELAPQDPAQDRHPSPPRPEEADSHLRDWYLTNITLPFPNKSAKERLTTLTGMDFRQLNTWFTNMRRRCGYTEMLRTFADGDKGRFEEMCGEAERGEGPEGLGDALQGMKAYVGKKPRGKVGDWLVNVSALMGILIMADFCYRSSKRATERRIRDRRRRHESQTRARIHVFRSRNTPSLDPRRQQRMNPPSPLSRQTSRTTPLRTNHPPRTNHQPQLSCRHPPRQSPLVHRPKSRSRFTPFPPAHQTKPQPRQQANVVPPLRVDRIPFEPSPTRARIRCKSSITFFDRCLARRPRGPTYRVI